MTTTNDTPKVTTTESMTTTDTTKKETTKMKLTEIKAKEFTPEAIDALSSTDLRKLIEVDFGQSVLSRERSEKYLVTVIRDERVKNISPQLMLSLSARKCWVKGTSVTFTSSEGITSTIAGHGVQTEADAEYNPSKEEFDAYTADELADIVAATCTKNRADGIVLAMIGGGLKVTHEDLVHLTNRRISIKGVEPPKVVVTSSNTPAEDVITGVSFG